MGYFTLKKSGFRGIFTRQVGACNGLTEMRGQNVCPKQGQVCAIMLCGVVILYGCGRKTEPIPAETQTRTVYFNGCNGGPLVQKAWCKPLRYCYPKD